MYDGCVEPQKSGRLYQWTSTSYTQWPIAIELTLNHGVPLWYGKQVTPDLGSLSNFDTWEKFEKAVKEQISYITKLTAAATTISQIVHRDMAPKPLMSIMYEGCMEHGKMFQQVELCIILVQELYGQDLQLMQIVWQQSKN